MPRALPVRHCARRRVRTWSWRLQERRGAPFCGCNVSSLGRMGTGVAREAVLVRLDMGMRLLLTIHANQSASMRHDDNPVHRIARPLHHRCFAHVYRLPSLARLLARSFCFFVASVLARVGKLASTRHVIPLAPSHPAHLAGSSLRPRLGPFLGPLVLALHAFPRHPAVGRHPVPDRRLRGS